MSASSFRCGKDIDPSIQPPGKVCNTPLMIPIILRDVEAGDPTEIEPAMRAFAERDYDLIIGVGFIASPILESVAKDYRRSASRSWTA